MSERPRHTSEQTFLRGQERRREIIEAAVELFARDGYRGTGLAAIAAKVGVSQPTLRHHFGTNQSLLRAVLERRREQDLAAASPFTKAGGAAVFDIVERMPDYMRRRQGLVHLNVVLAAENLSPDHPVYDWFAQQHNETRAVIRDSLRAGVEQGALNADMDVDVAAATIIALIEGVEVQWLLDPTSIDLDAVFISTAAGLRRYYARTTDRT
jgi:AcrR family transcriptional regulator